MVSFVVAAALMGQVQPQHVYVHKVPRSRRSRPIHDVYPPPWNPRLPKPTPRVTISDSYRPPSPPKMVENPYVQKPLEVPEPRRPKNSEFNIRPGERWTQAAYRMWYEEKTMPKTETQCRISRLAIEQMLCDHLEVQGEADIRIVDTNWIVEHGISELRVGVSARQVATLELKEVQNILIQECRAQLKAGPGSASVEFLLDDGGAITGAVVTLRSSK